MLLLYVFNSIHHFVSGSLIVENKGADKIYVLKRRLDFLQLYSWCSTIVACCVAFCGGYTLKWRALMLVVANMHYIGGLLCLLWRIRTKVADRCACCVGYALKWGVSYACWDGYALHGRIIILFVADTHYHCGFLCLLWRITHYCALMLVESNHWPWSNKIAVAYMHYIDNLS